jgi:hypothetical protein
VTGRRHHQSTGALGGTRELTVVPPPSGLSVLATYQEFEQARPACPTGSGPAESGLVGSGGPDPDDDGFRAAPLNDAPPGVIRLRFDDAPALERAGAAFAVAPDLGEAWSDPSTLTLRIVADAGVETLRAVLAVIDSAALAVRSLTVHTHELDDVFAAFTSLP